MPSGADVLDSAILWKSGAAPGGAGPVVRLTLIDPTGAYVANTRPQGGANPANYGDVLVRRPVAGTWTAVLYTPATSGFTGNVTLDAQSQRAFPVGSVSPSTFTLAPGASRAVHVTLPLPAVGGDTAYTMSLGSSGGHQTAVPVIMRALVPTVLGHGDVRRHHQWWQRAGVFSGADLQLRLRRAQGREGPGRCGASVHRQGLSTRRAC